MNIPQILRRGAGYAIRRIARMAPLRLQSRGSDSRIERPYKISNPRYIRLGSRTRILADVWLEVIKEYAGQKFDPRLTIGDDVYIGNRCCITCVGEVVIGNGCVLSEEVYVADSSHGYDPRAGLIMRQPLETKGPVVLEESCFIGYRAVISPGVRLGRHCVVGANSVVTKSFPSYSMVAGVPARLIKRFDTRSGQWTDTAGGGLT